jgi:predicted aspartyl protease
VAAAAARAETPAVPFELERGVVLVKGEVNGRGPPMTFILDTGATETVLTPPAAEKLGLERRPAGDGQEIARVRALTVGGVAASNLTVFVFDPPQAVPLRLDHGINYSGLLGYSFLVGFVTTLDYPRKVARFELHGPPWEAAPPGEGVARAPFEVVKHHILVPAFVNGHGPLRMLCDTGASETILTRETARRFGFHGLPMRSPPDAACMEGATVAVGGAKEEDFPVVLYTPETRDEGDAWDGILGASFLSRFVVTVDYRARTLTLRR